MKSYALLLLLIIFPSRAHWFIDALCEIPALYIKKIVHIVASACSTMGIPSDNQKEGDCSEPDESLNEILICDSEDVVDSYENGNKRIYLCIDGSDRQPNSYDEQDNIVLLFNPINDQVQKTLIPMNKQFTRISEIIEREKRFIPHSYGMRKLLYR